MKVCKEGKYYIRSVGLVATRHYIEAASAGKVLTNTKDVKVLNFKVNPSHRLLDTHLLRMGLQGCLHADRC